MNKSYRIARFEYEQVGPLLDVYDGSTSLDDSISENRMRMTRPLVRVPFRGSLEDSLRTAVDRIYEHGSQSSLLHVEFYKRSGDSSPEEKSYEFDWKPR